MGKLWARLMGTTTKTSARRQTRRQLLLETLENRACPSATPLVHYAVTENWGSGFQAQMSLTNQQATAYSSWQASFHYTGNITSIWDAKILRHTDDVYVVSGVAWDKALAAHGTVSFGFTSNSHNPPAPDHVTIINACTPLTKPVARNDSATTTTGQAVTISVLANDSAPAGRHLTVTAATQGLHGSVHINSAGTITYTPKAGYVGSDAFNYTISDGHGNKSTAQVSVTVKAPVTPPVTTHRVFAPYVDMTAFPTYNLTTAVQNGVKFFNLAFITADANNLPAWGGYTQYELGTTFANNMATQINSVRSMGGDVAVSFGGEVGTELALAYTDVTALTNAYQSVITAYGLTHIDFDIEGTAVSDAASIALRSQAIAQLEKNAAAAGRTLDVSFTLPASPTGLADTGLAVLQSAVHYGVTISLVNGMAMDYGDDAAPNPQGQMGAYAIDAAQGMFSQLKTLFSTKTDAQIWAMIGLTVEIGVNDPSDEVFGSSDAAQVEAFAKLNNIGELGMWNLNRDDSTFDFSKVFEAYQS